MVILAVVLAIRDTICKMQATQDTAYMEGPADIRAMAYTGATGVIQAAAMPAIRELEVIRATACTMRTMGITTIITSIMMEKIIITTIIMMVITATITTTIWATGDKTAINKDDVKRGTLAVQECFLSFS